ncbi:MerR family transcriptional regulator [Thermostaphylospora chromogena]|uniref:DNA-binding transcriptional regulator, MerR family n=1 Tax=Thermostaphylospora chromogena TaxID=35622 RepID=A0A1H1H3E9_9ACTN|nr:MerR family transcriptional regulator [Thermostaphylospora chromogena]SDR19960.1 DNA-binding transcriptional regulator, MerR family [Thermostaphylospora chromogena]
MTQRLPVDDEHAPLYSLGQVAEMLQVRQAFLRRLDSFSVVSPRRSAGGQRRYSRRDISAVQYVVRLTSEGMTLASIRRIMELEREVAELKEEVERLRARVAELEGDGPR